MVVTNEAGRWLRSRIRVSWRTGAMFLALGGAPVIGAGCGGPAAVPAAGSAGSEVAKSILGYLVGKIVDGIWDNASGKPDVVELDRRLQRVESELAGKPEQAQAVRELRGRITPNTTESEYRSFAQNTVAQLQEIERRLKRVENTVNDLQKPRPYTEQDKKDISNLDDLIRKQENGSR